VRQGPLPRRRPTRQGMQIIVRQRVYRAVNVRRNVNRVDSYSAHSNPCVCAVPGHSSIPFLRLFSLLVVPPFIRPATLYALFVSFLPSRRCPRSVSLLLSFLGHGGRIGHTTDSTYYNVPRCIQEMLPLEATATRRGPTLLALLRPVLPGLDGILAINSVAPLCTRPPPPRLPRSIRKMYIRRCSKTYFTAAKLYTIAVLHWLLFFVFFLFFFFFCSLTLA
jgi:hypothetical protein